MFNFFKPKVTIVTHNGKFHTDDVFAVATLLLVLEKEGRKAKIIRTRDSEIIKKADYVVDVGDIYDPEKNLFDHHQENGAGVRDNGVPYASFGIVWKKYGEGLCQNKEIADRIDLELVKPIDAYDNGFEIFESKIPCLYAYSLFGSLDVFNSTWKESNNSDQTFSEAILYVKDIIKRYIKVLQDKIEARDFVIEEYQKTKDKKLIVFSKYYPAEEPYCQFPEPLFMVYPKFTGGTWNLEAIRGDTGKYSRRKDLPESWAGKRDKELEEITSVHGAIFCHQARFIACS